MIRSSNMLNRPQQQLSSIALSSQLVATQLDSTIPRTHRSTQLTCATLVLSIAVVPLHSLLSFPPLVDRLCSNSSPPPSLTPTCPSASLFRTCCSPPLPRWPSPAKLRTGIFQSRQLNPKRPLCLSFVALHAAARLRLCALFLLALSYSSLSCY